MSKRKILILEDDPERIRIFRDKFHDCDLDMVDTSNDAIELLDENQYDLICLDHDLGGEVYVNSLDPNTGYQVTSWMSKNDHQNTDTPVVIHSFNPAGANNMYVALTTTNHKGKVLKLPGYWLQ